MRHLSLIFTTLSLFVALLLTTSCGTDNTETPVEVTTVVTLDNDSLEAVADGGTYSVNYTIENGLSGIDIVAQSSVQWIKEFQTQDGVLSFKIDANRETTPREGVITIKYPQVKNQIVKVSQLGADPIFNIAISNETSTSFVSKVTPKEKEKPFIVLLSEKRYLLGMTADDLFADDYAYVKSLAEENNVTDLEQFMLDYDIAFKESSHVKWTSMIPGKEYILYAYSIEFSADKSSYTLASPINHVPVTLKHPELTDVEFKVNVEVSGPAVTYEFEPINWDGKYYLDIHREGSYYYIEKDYSVTDEYSATVAQDWLTLIEQYTASGYSGEQLYRIMCLEGPDTFSEVLEADTKYMMSFYAIDMVDGLPQVVSRPYIHYFETEPVGASDMTIEFTIENLYTRVADITITPSKNEPYTIALVRKSEVLEGSNSDIINWMINIFNLQLYYEPYQTHLYTLDPDTEYSLLAFGYYGGVITTDLFRKDFKTDPEGECENSVLDVIITGPYSPLEFEKHFPDGLNGMGQEYENRGYYILTSEIITEKPATDMFHYYFEPIEFESKGLTGIFKELVTYPCDNVERYTARSGVPFIACGVTMDYRGNYSEMWVDDEPFVFNYTSETKRPIEELVEKLQTKPETTQLMIMR